MDAVVGKLVASVVVLAACATAGEQRLAGDPDAPANVSPDAPACIPTVELCNGLDDDCDNKIDEDFQVGTACDGDDEDTCKTA
jgi:hypothetical protein